LPPPPGTLPPLPFLSLSPSFLSPLASLSFPVAHAARPNPGHPSPSARHCPGPYPDVVRAQSPFSPCNSTEGRRRDPPEAVTKHARAPAPCHARLQPPRPRPCPCALRRATHPRRVGPTVPLRPALKTKQRRDASAADREPPVGPAQPCCQETEASRRPFFSLRYGPSRQQFLPRHYSLPPSMAAMKPPPFLSPSPVPSLYKSGRADPSLTSSLALSSRASLALTV
jgi:hypothetical protein